MKEDILALVKRDLKGWSDEEILEYTAKLLHIIYSYDPLTRKSVDEDIQEMKENEDDL